MKTASTPLFAAVSLILFAASALPASASAIACNGTGQQPCPGGVVPTNVTSLSNTFMPVTFPVPSSQGGGDNFFSAYYYFNLPPGLLSLGDVADVTATVTSSTGAVSLSSPFMGFLDRAISGATGRLASTTSLTTSGNTATLSLNNITCGTVSISLCAGGPTSLDPSHTMYAVQITLNTGSTAPGTLTLSGGVDMFNPSQVPEIPLPAALPLMGSVLGLGGLVAGWRKRRSKQVAV